MVTPPSLSMSSTDISEDASLSTVGATTCESLPDKEDRSAMTNSSLVMLPPQSASTKSNMKHAWVRQSAAAKRSTPDRNSASLMEVLAPSGAATARKCAINLPAHACACSAPSRPKAAANPAAPRFPELSATS